MGLATVVLLGVSCAVFVIMCAVSGWGITVLNAFIASPETSGVSGVRLAGMAQMAVAVLCGVTVAVTGIVFLVWLFRARANAETMTAVRHRRAKPWLILGWIVPVVSLWFPKQILDDIWRSSHPDHPRDGSALSAVPRPGIGYVWWTTAVVLLLSEVMSEIALNLRVGVSSFALESVSPMVAMEVARELMGHSVVLGLFGIVGGVAAAMLVHRITGFQEQYRRGGVGRSSAVQPMPTARA